MTIQKHQDPNVELIELLTQEQEKLLEKHLPNEYIGYGILRDSAWSGELSEDGKMYLEVYRQKAINLMEKHKSVHKTGYKVTNKTESTVGDHTATCGIVDLEENNKTEEVRGGELEQVVDDVAEELKSILEAGGKPDMDKLLSKHGISVDMDKVNKSNVVYRSIVSSLLPHMLYEDKPQYVTDMENQGKEDKFIYGLVDKILDLRISKEDIGISFFGLFKQLIGQGVNPIEADSEDDLDKIVEISLFKAITDWQSLGVPVPQELKEHPLYDNILLAHMRAQDIQHSFVSNYSCTVVGNCNEVMETIVIGEVFRICYFLETLRSYRASMGTWDKPFTQLELLIVTTKLRMNIEITKRLNEVIEQTLLEAPERLLKIMSEWDMEKMNVFHDMLAHILQD